MTKEQKARMASQIERVAGEAVSWYRGGLVENGDECMRRIAELAANIPGYLEQKIEGETKDGDHTCTVYNRDNENTPTDPQSQDPE